VSTPLHGLPWLAMRPMRRMVEMPGGDPGCKKHQP